MKVLEFKPFSFNCGCGRRVETTFDELAKAPYCAGCGGKLVDGDKMQAQLSAVRELDEALLATAWNHPGS